MTILDTTDHDDWLAAIEDRLRQTCDEQTTQLLDLLGAGPDSTDASRDALVAATRQSIADATQALRRIEQGSYGTCESCGATIPAERLEVVPHARTCVSCAR
jgi:RNA polymerase-binding transcription factor DksA